MINTIYGEIPEDSLVKSSGSSETEEEIIEWVEYRKDGELVHRSVDIKVKQGLVSSGTIYCGE